MSELLQRATAEILGRKLFSRGQKILVAVSGGADSMVLLDVLNSLAKQNRWKISVAHFNHRLRGRASDADEKLVRQTAKKLRLKFFGGGADVKSFAAQSKLSVEMAARKLRHEFLARTARDEKISTIALAHHADDQVELFFLRLLRGAGGEGLAGMKWCSPSPADKVISLVRPLLGFTKDELLAFAREGEVRFRNDATNFSSDFLRNRIRNELLPLLQKKYQPGLGKTVLRLMEIVGAETEFVAEVARQWLAKPKSGFQKLPVAVQRKILQLRLTEIGCVTDFELIEQLRLAPGKAVSVAAGVEMVCDISGNVSCQRQTDNDFNLAEHELKLQGRAGQVGFSDRKFSCSLKSFNGSQGGLLHQSGTEFFDADKIGREIILRHWRPGDRFQPIGLKSAAKLQDLFVNAKIPAARRRALVLATTKAGDIFWVEGLRIGEKFKLASGTKRKLIWKYPKIAG